jgi:hypothetical protein
MELRKMKSTPVAGELMSPLNTRTRLVELELLLSLQPNSPRPNAPRTQTAAKTLHLRANM